MRFERGDGPRLCPRNAPRLGSEAILPPGRREPKSGLGGDTEHSAEDPAPGAVLES